MTFNILSIHTGHNSSIAFLEDGELTYYIEEERLTRLKRDGSPFRSMIEVLTNNKVDLLVIGGTESTNLFEIPWTRENPFASLARKYHPNIKVIDATNQHHLGHAASAFYGSGFDRAAVIVVDGAGSLISAENNIEFGYETESIYILEYPGSVTEIKKNYGKNSGKHLTDGVSKFSFSAAGIVKSYEAVTSYLGFPYIEAGKTMGLSSFGKPNPTLSNFLYQNRGDANKFFLQYPAGAELTAEPINTDWHYDFSTFNSFYADIALKIQEETQKAVGDLIEEAISTTGLSKVCISGGYGLNCVANYYYTKRFPNIEFFIDPTSYDGGTAIGLAKLYWYINSASNKTSTLDSLYLGPQYDITELEYAIQNCTEITYKKIQANKVAQLLANGNVIAIYQGKSEAGPRALGNRSILYDPRDPKGTNYVNAVKRREWFRPFAGSILEEYATEYFDMSSLKNSPFMMFAVDVLKEKQDIIPAITHVDGTCRVQTVSEKNNKYYYDLITEFNNITGVPILLNTSFNLAGEPLVETIQDAISTLVNSQIDYLYLPEIDLLVQKNENSHN